MHNANANRAMWTAYAAGFAAEAGLIWAAINWFDGEASAFNVFLGWLALQAVSILLWAFRLLVSVAMFQFGLSKAITEQFESALEMGDFPARRWNDENVSQYLEWVAESDLQPMNTRIIAAALEGGRQASRPLQGFIRSGFIDRAQATALTRYRPLKRSSKIFGSA